MWNSVTIKCCQCGEEFGLQQATHDTLRRSSANFHCPFGHKQHFPQGPSEEDKLRRERDRLKQQMAYKDDQIREARERADKERNRANGYKGHATRITKRAKAGVCPCCNRTFKQLAAHMASKHPQFTPIEIEEGISLQ